MSSWTFFRLVGGEISGSQHHQLSGSNQSGFYVLVGSIQLTSPTCRIAQKYCYVCPLKGNQDLSQDCTIVS